MWRLFRRLKCLLGFHEIDVLPPPRGWWGFHHEIRYCRHCRYSRPRHVGPQL